MTIGDGRETTVDSYLQPARAHSWFYTAALWFYWMERFLRRQIHITCLRVKVCVCTVAYLLRARIVDLEIQPLLSNSFVNRRQ
jgi:hypothetical protein